MEIIIFVKFIIFLSFNHCIVCTEIERKNLHREHEEDIDLSYALPQYGNIKVLYKIECHERRSQSLAWLHYANFFRCVNLVTDTILPSCLYKQLEHNGLIYMIKDRSLLVDEVQHDRLRRSPCPSFIILTQDLEFIKEIFGAGRHIFRPFTNIFLFVPSNMTIPQEYILRTIQLGYNLYKIRNRFFDESVPYFSLNYWHLTNIQTNRTLHTFTQNEAKIAEFFGTSNDHPLFDKTIEKTEPFRIGVFHCPPNIIIRDYEKRM